MSIYKFKYSSQMCSISVSRVNNYNSVYHSCSQQLQYASAVLFRLLRLSLHLCELSRCYSYSLHAS